MRQTASQKSNDARAGSTPARVVLLLQDLSFGGTQRQALELARGLDPGRFAPELWTMTSGADFVPLAKHYGLPVRVLRDAPTVGLASIKALRDALAAEPIDLLLLLTAVPNIWGRILGRLAKIPVIVGSCRGGGAPKRQHERFLKNLAHHHVCNSKALSDVLTRDLGLPADRVSFIPNGVDVAHFQPPPEELRPVREVILCMARLCQDKDHETLLKAFEIVAERNPRAELRLVGTGPLAPAVHRQIARHRARSRIRMFPGGDPRPFYQQAQILCLSSVREGLPNVILEGMAMGLPTAATNVGGIPDAVTHGATGLLAPPHNPKALADILCELLDIEEKRLAFGQAAREQAVSRFSLKAMTDSHQDLFDRLLGRA